MVSSSDGRCTTRVTRRMKPYRKLSISCVTTTARQVRYAFDFVLTNTVKAMADGRYYSIEASHHECKVQLWFIEN